MVRLVNKRSENATACQIVTLSFYEVRNNLLISEIEK